MPNLSLTLTTFTLADIEARTAGDGRTGLIGKSGVVERDLQRYYIGVDRARRKLAKLFTPDEAGALCDNLNGVFMAESPEISMQGIPLNVEDGIALSGLDKKWGLDAQSFLAKLRGLEWIELCAIADCVERFWLKPEADPREIFSNESKG